MKLTVVGCSGSAPGPASATSCYLVETDHGGRTWRMLLDVGVGALGPLQRYCDPADLDLVAISHLHLDHYGDLASLHVYLAYGSDRADPVRVLGPAQTAQAVATLRGADQPSERLNVNTWQVNAVQEVGPWTVTVAPVVHPVPAYAIKVEGPSSVTPGATATMVYSGDSAYCDVLVDLARGADLFLGEASFLDGQQVPPGLHLTGTELGRVAREAQVGRLVVTHVPPWHDAQRAHQEAAQSFGGPTQLAAPGAYYLL